MPDKETKNEKNSKENEIQQTETIPEIELLDFRQYVQNGIPYNGTVKDVGKIEYDENLVLVLRSVENEEPTAKDYEWLNQFLTFTSTASESLAWGWQWGLELKQYNPWGWTDASGSYNSIKRLEKNPVTQKYPRGYNLIKNSQSIAKNKVVPVGKVTSVAKFASNTTGAITVALSFKDLMDSRIECDDTKGRGAFVDIIFGCIAFVPYVGWVISGVYFITDYYVEKKTGKKMYEHLEDSFIDKMWKLENSIIREFNKFVSMCMP